MPEKTRNFFLYVIGAVFLIFGIASVVNSLYRGNGGQILWGCYAALLILGIGAIGRKELLVGSQLCVLILPVLVWNIDFVYQIVSGNELWGITSYMFEGIGFSQIISLQHVISVPLGVIALALIKPKRFDFWKIAFIEVIFLFFAVALFTKPSANINCVFESCVPFEINFPYAVAWLVGFYIVILVTNYGLWRFLKKD